MPLTNFTDKLTNFKDSFPRIKIKSIFAFQ